MSAVNGRLDDMLIIRGVNLYPTEVESVVLGMSGLGSNYQLVVERPGTLDELTVVCELTGRDADNSGLQGRVEHAIREAIGLAVKVELLAPGGLPPSEGKAVRVVDRRGALT
jgi:phenylacetate-CoA ligase